MFQKLTKALLHKDLCSFYMVRYEQTNRPVCEELKISFCQNLEVLFHVPIPTGHLSIHNGMRCLTSRHHPDLKRNERPLLAIIGLCQTGQRTVHA